MNSAIAITSFSKQELQAELLRRYTSELRDPCNLAMAIIEMIAYELDTTAFRLRSRTRKQPTVDIRNICFVEIRERTKLPLTTVARIFNRDHSTVIHGVKRYGDLFQMDKDFRSKALRAKEALVNL